jgi:hypothetical protein
MSTLTKLKYALEYLGGSRDECVWPLPPLSNWFFWGLWWYALAALIYCFCGQSSKFIYVDF